MKHHIIACALIIIFPTYSAYLTDKKENKTQTQTIGLRFYERIKQYRCPNSYPKEELPASFESEFKELIAAFKKEGQDINNNYFDENEFNSAAGTPLTMALKAKLSDNLIQEIIKAGADVNKKDIHNDIPLIVAVYANREETVKTLLANGASPNIRDVNKRPILHGCAYFPSIGTIALRAWCER